MAADTASPDGTWRTSRWLAWGEIAFVVALIVADLHRLVPFSKTPFLLVLGWISLRMRGVGWRGVGFAAPRGWIRTITLGCLAGVAMELVSTFVSVPFLARLAGKPPDLADFRPLVGNPGLLLAALALNWTLAAFGEELVYRGYLMSRAADLGQGSRGAWLAGLVGISALFGWGHVDQGITGMVQESLAGLMLGALYLGARRNLALPIIAHGASNTLALVLIYFDRYPGV